MRFDLSVFPGLYRAKVDVPNVLFESGYHMWEASADLTYYSTRHELRWKDQVYCDISYSKINSNTRLIRAECVNMTDVPQNLVLHMMASMHYPTPSYMNFDIAPVKVLIPNPSIYLDALEYENLTYHTVRPSDGLVWDGKARGEEAVEGFTRGYGIGCDFGKEEGDRVTYRVSSDISLTSPMLGIRYLNLSDRDFLFLLNGEISINLPPAKMPNIAIIALPKSILADRDLLTLTTKIPGNIKIDSIFLCESEAVDQVAYCVQPKRYEPEIFFLEKERFLILKYVDAPEYYGLHWNYGNYQFRTIINDELDYFFRYYVHDHIRDSLQGNNKGHFSNIFLRPIPLKPHSSSEIFGVICNGISYEEVLVGLREQVAKNEKFTAIYQRNKEKSKLLHSIPEGNDYLFSQERMLSVVLSNVVFPVYTKGEYIKHNTPGKWWDCLYTWDSGMIGMGLSGYSAERGVDCLRAYLTEPGDEQTAFIHHGSLVPTQFYLFQELMNITQNYELARYSYPRLKQYYLFLTGKLGSSTLGDMNSKLLRPWDYFYNSGGWDDYPPQMHVMKEKLTQSVSPVNTTAQVIRCAKILLMTAKSLIDKDEATLNEDIFMYEKDIHDFTESLMNYSWDEDAGYFSYVIHDDQKNATGILRHNQGQNYNMGLDGASPLLAQVCSYNQMVRIINALKSKDKLWTTIGISTVDQSADYYKEDGYWNGAVWMPYQWLFFKAMLDCGECDFAFQIAQTALELWKREVNDSYNCYEHFLIASERGAGWHQFSGLSSPVLQWFRAYYTPGTITCGHSGWITKVNWKENATRLTASLRFIDSHQKAYVLVVLNPTKTYQFYCNELPIISHMRFNGMYEICLNVEKYENYVIKGVEI